MSPSSCISLLPSTPSHPSRLSEHQVELPVLYRNFPLASYFTYGSVHVSMPLFQLVPPSPSLTVLTSLFSKSTSLVLPCKWVHQNHGYVVISPCEFNLYFPNGKYWWIIFSHACYFISSLIKYLFMSFAHVFKF